MFYKILHLMFSKASVVITNIVLLIIASRYLSLHDYATFRQTFLPYEIMAPIVAMGIPSTIYYLLPRRLDKLNLIFQSMLIMSFSSLIFSSFLMFGGIGMLAKLFNNADLNHSMKWLIIFPFFQIPITLLLSVFIYEGKTKFVGAYSSAYGLVFSLCAIWLLIFYRDYMDIVILKVLFPALGAVLLFYYTLRLFYATTPDKIPFLESALNILKISIPFGLASMIGAGSMQLDKVLLSSLGTTEEFAIYVNGAMEIPLIGILTGSISEVLIGEMSTNIKEKNYGKALSLFRRSANKTALILFPVMIFFIFNAKEFMILIYSDKYASSALPFTILLFLLPIRIVVFGSVLIAMGKSKLILHRSLIEIILNLIISIIAYKIFGYLSIAIATVLVTYLWSVPYNIIEISKGFAVKKRELRNIRMLSKIMIISLFAFPVMSLPALLDVKALLNIPGLLNVLNLLNIACVKMVLSFIIYSFVIMIFYQYFGLVKFEDLKAFFQKKE